jgi:hypothetical protein
LRQEYFQRVAATICDDKAIRMGAEQSDGFSFAQLREAYILAGQIAFQRGDGDICSKDLIVGIEGVKNAMNSANGWLGDRDAGFAAITSSAKS